ncbi:MAG: MarR family transcriptional regulator, partial [Pseudomonadota bacterium]
TNSQKVALSHLERDGSLTISALARLAGVRPQSMSATVAAMEAQGLVAAKPDPKDGRQMLYALTPACMDYLRTMRAAREDWLYSALLSKLSPTQRADLARAVPLVALLAD